MITAPRRSREEPTADDRSSRKRTKIAPIERVAGLPVYQEDLAVGERVAALPYGKLSAMAISFASRGLRDAIDHDGEMDAANSLSGKGKHPF
jgi:hypothetical protein